MSEKQKRVAFVAFLAGPSLLVVALLGYWFGIVRANPIPTSGALHYAGYLEQGGVPVDGPNDMKLRLWADPTSTNMGDLRCETVAQGVSVTAGRFRLVLSESCTDAVRTNANLWVEIEVETRIFPREKLGAVPYAVQAENGVPVGTIIAYAGATTPPGWLPCDGFEYDKNVYPRLAAALADTWGAPSVSTKFKVPDLRGRAAIGAGQGAGLSDRALASAFGAETHTLNGNQIPAHTHYMDSNIKNLNPGYRLASSDPYGYDSYYGRTMSSRVFHPQYGPPDRLSINGGDGGGGQAHNNMQPSAVVNYIIRY